MGSKTLLTDILSYNQPTPGAMLFALEQQRRLLSAQGSAPAQVDDPGLKTLVDEAIGVNTDSRALAFDWRNQRRMEPLRRAGIGEVDGRSDRALSQLDTAISNWARMEVDSDLKKLASNLKKAVFAEGVFVTTSLRYEDQKAAVDELTQRMRTEFSAEITRLALEPFVAQLEAINVEYGARLSGTKANTVTYDQVQEAHRVGLQAYFKIILRIWSDYIDDPATRAKLLAPVEEQNTRVSAYYKRRGAPPEVDPETGEVVDPDELSPATEAPMVADAPVSADA